MKRKAKQRKKLLQVLKIHIKNQQKTKDSQKCRVCKNLDISNSRNDILHGVLSVFFLKKFKYTSLLVNRNLLEPFHDEEYCQRNIIQHTAKQS